MKRFLLTIATLALLATPVQAGMKYPNWFAFEMILAEHGPGLHGQPYFQCDYAAQICLKGFAMTDSYYGGVHDFTGVVLDGNDRTTELRHLRCMENFARCADYDIGLTVDGRPVPIPDMPAACVELFRTTGRYNSGDGPCKGYSIAFNYLEGFK
jgi:hypothetical protein